MEVLVIGGTKFFGKRIVEQLLARGDKVTVLSRGHVLPPWIDQVKHIQGDRSDTAAMKSLLAECAFDAVIDNIAFNRHDVRLILDALGNRVGHYILTSTGSVYSNPEQLTPIEESDVDLAEIPPEYDQNDFAQSYGINKRQAELVLRERQGPCWTVIRPPVVLGPEDPSLRLYWYIQRITDGGPLLHPIESWATVSRHIFSEDIARLYLLCLDREISAGRTYNAGQLELLTPSDWIGGIARLLGTEVRVVLGPDEKIQTLLSQWYPPLSFRFVQSTFAARRDLDFKSTPFAHWLDVTTRWFVDTYSGADSAGYRQRAQEVEVAERLMRDGCGQSVSFGRP